MSLYVCAICLYSYIFCISDLYLLQPDGDALGVLLLGEIGELLFVVYT